MTSTIAPGNAALKRGDYESALRSALDRLGQDAGDIGALEICARAYDKLGNTAKAAEALAKLVRRQPDGVWAYLRLTEIFLSFQRVDKAEPLLRQALRYCPVSADLHLQMGKLLSDRNQRYAGEWHFREALRLEPDRPAAMLALAANLVEQGHVDEADDLYEAAHTLDARDADMLGHWSRLAELRGSFDVAAQRLQAAEAIRPGGFRLLRARLAARRGDTEAALAAIGDEATLNGDALLERGRLYEELGRYDDAWRDYGAGKAALVRADPALHYDRPAVDAFIDDLRATFTEELVSRLPLAEVRDGTAQPVFIVGAPRSGSTLIEQVLASHSDIRAGGELTFIAELREFSERVIGQGKFPGNLAWTGTGDLRHVGTLFRDLYLARAAEYGLADSSERYFTDKMPWNELYLPLLRMAFPHAPVLLMRRHPLDILVSMFANKLNHGFHCAYRPQDISHHLDRMDALFRHYATQFGSGVLEIRYESFVAGQQEETARILDYLQLDFQAACLEFHRNARYVATPSYRQVAAPVTSSAVGRHEHFRNHLAPVADALRGLLARNDYSAG